MAAVGRPLISDPEWSNKMRAGSPNAIDKYTPDANETYP